MIFSPFLWNYGIFAIQLYHENGDKLVEKYLESRYLIGLWSFAIN